MRYLKIACFISALFGVANFIAPLAYGIENSPEYQGPLSFIITVVTVAVTAMLAKKLHRSAWGWGIFSLLLPFVSGFIIPFLGVKKYYGGGDYDYSGGSGYTSTYLSDKSCSACGRSVPLSSASGQCCPYCGAYWSTETTVHRS